MAGPDYWQLFWEECKGKELDYIVDNYPEVREVEVRAGDLFNYMGKETFFLALQDDPMGAYQDVWFGLNEAVSDADNDIFPKITGRISDVITLQDALTNKHHQYFTTEAFVMVKSDGNHEILTKDYQCEQCKFDHYGLMASPKKCENCGKTFNNKWDVVDGEVIDLTVVELGDNTKDGSIISARGYIFGLDTKSLAMGQRVKLNCIKNIVKEGKKWTSSLFIMGWESADQSWNDVKINNDFSVINREEYFKKMIESIAPSIVGFEDIKISILLQMVMGGFSVSVDGTKTRDWLNILIASDPGMAKSKLMEYTEMLWPKVVWGGGSRSSKAGLTVAMIEDPLTKGKKIPMAGTLVRANGGLALIDEMDKMAQTDQKSIQSAMENGVVNVAMAETHATFKSETSILACCNPKEAFWRDVSYGEKMDRRKEVEIPGEIESRFDLYWVLRDRQNRDRDGEIAESVLTGGVEKEYLKPSEMTEYCAWARKEPEPIITPELLKDIKVWYQDMREKHLEDRMITPRTLASIKRMSVAFAKLRGSKGLDDLPIVTAGDFHYAKDIYHKMLSSLAGKDTWDTNPQYKHGLTMKKDIIQQKIIDLIKTYKPTTDELTKYMSEVDPEKIEDALELLQNKMNRIFKGNDNKWRMV